MKDVRFHDLFPYYTKMDFLRKAGFEFREEVREYDANGFGFFNYRIKRIKLLIPYYKNTLEVPNHIIGSTWVGINSKLDRLHFFDKLFDGLIQTKLLQVVLDADVPVIE